MVGMMVVCLEDLRQGNVSDIDVECAKQDRVATIDLEFNVHFLCAKKEKGRREGAGFYSC
jgi:hypothetical protein